MKRIKQVYPTHEVAHLWASQKLEKARNAQRNLYFEGKSIFSYGDHFEIARFITDDVVLMNSRGYSVTTSMHQSLVKQAVSHKTVFEVPSMAQHGENAEYLTKLVADHISRFKRIRSGFKYEYVNILMEQRTLLAYVNTFKKGIPLAQRNVSRRLARAVFVTDKERRTWNKRQKAHDASVEKASQTRYANRIKDNELRAAMWDAEQLWSDEIQRLNLDAWKNGARIRLPYGAPMMLRIVGEDIETSQGARVPVADAVSLWKALKAKEPIKDRAIGHYTISGIHAGKLVVGCHNIPVKELARMAKVLNLESEAA